MKISSHQPQSLPASTSELPVERIAQNQKLSEEEKVGQLSQQFEALLLRQILQNARKPVIPSKLNKQSAEGSIYDDMVTNQMAQGISHSDALGLAETLQKQLTRQLLQSKPSQNGAEPAP